MANEQVVKNDTQKEKIRNLISTFYDIQKLRIATGNRIVASFNIQLGNEPGQSQEDMEDKENVNMIKSLRDEYKRITDGYVGKQKTIKGRVKEMAPDLVYIKNETDYKLIEQYERLMTVEEDTEKVIKKEVEEHPLYEAFFKDVKGCGPLMSAVCIAYLDPYKARHVSSFWKYAGLDVVIVEKEDGSMVGEGRRKGHTEMFDYVDANGEVKQKRGITYNPTLKTKLVGVLGSSFIKCKDSKYGDIYRGYKFRLENNPKYAEYTKMHRHNMAVRYAVKQFLRDLWVAWRQLEGLRVDLPYEVEVLGMEPHGYNDGQVKAASHK
jgi:hypothetical protein